MAPHAVNPSKIYSINSRIWRLVMDMVISHKESQRQLPTVIFARS
jgi:hypothetical protein